MRCLLLASILSSAVFAVAAQPLCNLATPSPVAGVAEAPPVPRGVQLPVIQLPLPAPGPEVGSQPNAPRSAAPALDAAVLRRVAASGASLTSLGIRHGLQSVVAQAGGEFLMLWVSPSGAAAVAGFPVDLSVSLLEAVSGGAATDLGQQHGLRAILVRSGAQFQIFYATPDGERVIPGIMWDGSGKNLTRELLASVEGALPTVSLGTALPSIAAPSPVPSVGRSAGNGRGAERLAALERAVSGTIGNPDAPHVWVFADPQCGYSTQAMQRLQPLVTAGRLRLSVIPVAILDHQNDGRSTTASLAMLGHSGEQMIAAWSRGDLQAPAIPAAAIRLQTNMAAANTVEIRGTPTFFWRRAGGGEGRHDGMPSDVEAFIASVRGG